MDTHCRGRTQGPVPRALFFERHLSILIRAHRTPMYFPIRDVKLLSSTSSVRRLEHYSYNYSVSFCRLRVCAHVNTFPSLGQHAPVAYALATTLTMRNSSGALLPITSSPLSPFAVRG
jgi:hypothetical protein